MSQKTRLSKLEKSGSNELWALIGIGKPTGAEDQRLREIQARKEFYASGGDRDAYLAFLPFDDFDRGFLGYTKRSEFINNISDRSRNPAERSRKLPAEPL